MAGATCHDITLTTASSKPRKRRPKFATLRASKRIREKFVESTKGFSYEIVFNPLDQAAIGSYGANSATPAGASAKADMEEALKVLRQLAGGRFKIISHETARRVRTTVMLERHTDVILLTMIASALIYRVYKLISIPRP